MDPLFSGESLLNWLQLLWAWLLGEVFTPANVVYTAMQIPAVVGTGFAAWWVHDFVFPPLAARIRDSAINVYGRYVLLKLARLIFPLLWGLGLTLAWLVALQFAWPATLIRVAVNLVIAWIVVRLVAILVRDPLWAKMVVVVAFGVAALNILGWLEPTLVLLDRLALSAGELRLSLLNVLQGMFSLGLLLWIAMLASRVLERRIRKVPNLTPSVQVLIGKLLKVTLITLAVLVSLNTVGVDFTALAVFGGAVGVGAGFGLQKVVSNLISGIIILMDKSIKPGDIIRIKDTYGWVSSLGARYVAVETRDGYEYLIPNEDIITQQVVNWSHRDELARLKVQIKVAYTEDIPKALELMVEAASKPQRVVDKPAPRALLIAFGDGPVELELRFWIKDVQNGIRNISSEVMLEIWKSFRDHGILLPIPQRRLWVETLPEVSLADGRSDREQP